MSKSTTFSASETSGANGVLVETPASAPGTNAPESIGHGSIGLIKSACTVCMICVRECPVWCISITAHTEPDPDAPVSGRGRGRSRNVLDEFSIDYGLCMYCGICIEECPFDALVWAGKHHDGVTEPTDLVAKMAELETVGHKATISKVEKP